jgi:hypothetical protein
MISGVPGVNPSGWSVTHGTGPTRTVTGRVATLNRPQVTERVFDSSRGCQFSWKTVDQSAILLPHVTQRMRVW